MASPILTAFRQVQKFFARVCATPFGRPDQLDPATVERLVPIRAKTLLTTASLKALARARLADAEALCRSRRFDCAGYLCGYVVEIALKARICRTLKWSAFPEKRSEFEGIQSFKTHDLVVLLRLSGREAYIRESLFPEWTILRAWNPEARYRPIGSITASAVRDMIAAARKVMMKL